MTNGFDLGRLAARTLGAVMAACCAATALASPSFADAVITSDGGTLYPGCYDIDYHLEVDHPEAASWEVDVFAYDPDGYEAGSDYDYGTGSAGFVSGSFFLCEFDGAGRYTMEADVSYYDSDDNLIGSDFAQGAFRMARRETHTYLHVSDPTPRFNSVVRLVATSLDERRAGWGKLQYEWVTLEARCDKSGWRHVRDSRELTDERGKAVWRYRWNVRFTCAVRAVTAGSDSFAKSTSSARWLNPWGRTAALRSPHARPVTAAASFVP